MIKELLIFGGIWFWIVVGGFALWFVIATFREKGGQTFSATLLLLGVLLFFSNFNIFQWIYDNPLPCFYWAGGYLGIGIVWAVIKWYLFNTKVRSVYNNLRAAFLEAYGDGSDTIPNQCLEKWGEYLSNEKSWKELTRYYEFKKRWTVRSINDVIPSPSQYKDNIIFWMMHWPLSFIFFFLGDFLERLFTRIYQAISSMFEGITKRIFKSIPDDFAKE